VLSVNRQRVGFTDEVVGLEGLEVGAVSIGQAHREIASGVAAAIPGLWGCVGIDFIEAPSGITVLEVNPRLTTSFAALHRATGLNPARLTLALCRDGGLGESDIDSPALPVELQLGGLHAG
jgi:predicted ATP-grasp superfamily ATP-dependent carboligase